jgi:hypothetical protein
MSHRCEKKDDYKPTTKDWLWVTSPAVLLWSAVGAIGFLYWFFWIR